MSNPTYTPISSVDTENRGSSHDQLLPTTNPAVSRQTFPNTYKITFHPSIALRVLSTILALIAFIILVIDGREAFIAADIFLMVLIIFNVLMVAHYFISHIFKVTVELRQQPWNKNKNLDSASKPKVSTLFDMTISGLVLLCIIIGNATTNRWGGGYKAGVVLGYFVALFQVLQALSIIDSKQLTLTASLSDSPAMSPRDTKASDDFDVNEREANRRREAEAEAARQTAEDIV